MTVTLLIVLLLALCIGTGWILRDQPYVLRVAAISAIAALYQFIPLMTHELLDSWYYYKQSDQALAFGLGYFYFIALPGVVVAGLSITAYVLKRLFRSRARY